jgi:simple sugar transport system ATP-binding protein
MAADRDSAAAQTSGAPTAWTAQKAPHASTLQVLGMSKAFGTLVALDDVSIEVAAGSFHALLGENGAGKSTLVKCIMGFYRPDRGRVLVDGTERAIINPRDARAAGIGMVYQSSTLVPSLTAAENLVLARGDVPLVVDWARERSRLESFLERMPFRLPLDRRVDAMAAGEKQKLEILRLLYLDQRVLILDEPTSVLTPGEADEILGLLRDMAARGEVSVLMITHRFREVRAFAETVTVMRRGCCVGTGPVREHSDQTLATMMIGHTALREPAARAALTQQPVALEIAGVSADTDDGRSAIESIALELRRGEILGIAGVSGNGQVALVEALAGQRALSSGRFVVDGRDYRPTRQSMARCKVFVLPEEPLKNAVVPQMSVAENVALRTFDRAPIAVAKWWLSRRAMRRQARELITRYRIKTPSTETAVEELSGGNVQRTVLARELSGDVGVLIVANPCFGLDFATVAEIRAQLIEQRNKGAAVLLVSEDLDEIFELADRIAVMCAGRVTYVSPSSQTDRATVGAYMAGRSG